MTGAQNPDEAINLLVVATLVHSAGKYVSEVPYELQRKAAEELRHHALAANVTLKAFTPHGGWNDLAKAAGKHLLVFHCVLNSAGIFDFVQALGTGPMKKMCCVHDSWPLKFADVISCLST